MTTAGLGVLALVAGTAGGLAAMTGDEQARAVTAVKQEAAVAAPPTVPAEPPAVTAADPAGRAADKAVVGDDRSAPGEADRTATRAPRRAEADERGAKSPAKPAVPAAPAGPVVHTERVSETHTIPFQTLLVRDPSLPRGSKRVQTRGVPGERVLHYEVTYTGTEETARRLIASTVTREPQHRVIAFGNRRDSGDGHSGRDRDRDRWCGGDRGECAPAGRVAVCSDETMPEEEKLLDRHLGLLSAEDLNALDLTLPCDEVPAPAEKPEAETPGRT
ncbi:hypothetical protein GCM10010166_05240 [Couchioplanes caeruleus subsp. azureus]|nr:hypothetical protein GCM10010166_05240 [Couchioplanes caeruleus subsp. azureus]